MSFKSDILHYKGEVLGLLVYTIRRILFLFILIIGVATMVFIISHMVPSDPVAAFLSERSLSNPEIVEAFKIKWGLDKPLYMQYLVYMKSLLRGDLGTSIRTGRPVITDLIQFLPATVELAFFSMIIATLLGVLFGVISAMKQNSLLDQVFRTISVIGVSIPPFWFALVMLYVFYVGLHWLPGPGRISLSIEPLASNINFYILGSILQGNWVAALDSFKHIILPSVVLGSFHLGLISRTTRANLLETLSTDYIRTAKAKGLPEGLIMRRHALGNALIPVITVIGLGLANLLGGTVLIENIFSWPGIGRYAYLSVINLDFAAITGVALLVAVAYLVVNMVVDILYGVIDPRVRY